MRIITTLFYFLLIILGVSFAALNASPIEVNFYITTMTLPVSLLIILVLGVGIIVGFTILLFRFLRLTAENRKLKSQLKLTEQEIKNLRTIPVTDHYSGFGEN